jgi:excisionase family DNA binding protein
VRPAYRPEEQTGEGAGSKADDTLWDVAGIAAYLQVPTSAVYKMTARRAAVRIPHIRLGGKLRFRRSDIEQWLTLLTDSNLKTLEKVRQKSLEGNPWQRFTNDGW